VSNPQTVILSFTGSTSDKGNQYASDLKDFLTSADPAIQIAKRPDRSDTQDFGSTLVLVLGTTGATALAHGIATWLKRNSGARITVKNARGELVAEGLESKDVARIVQAISNTNQNA
jgi:hypothetical protein